MMTDELTPHSSGPWGCGLEGADPGLDGPAVVTLLSQYLELFRNANHHPALALPDLAFRQVSGTGPRSWERVGGCAESGLVSGSVSQHLYLSQCLLLSISVPVYSSLFLCPSFYSQHLPLFVCFLYVFFSLCISPYLSLP